MLSLLDRPTGNFGVELGVAAGDFSAELLDSGCFDLLYGVDAYADHHDIDEYKIALCRLGMSGRYLLFRMWFDDALDLFDDNSLDFVFIDGYAHTGQEGGETIFAWATKVKLGGVLSGHDYDPTFPLTIKAVDRFVTDTGFDLHVTDSAGGYPAWAVVKTTQIENVGPPPGLRRAGRRARLLARLRQVFTKPAKYVLRAMGLIRR